MEKKAKNLLLIWFRVKKLDLNVGRNVPQLSERKVLHGYWSYVYVCVSFTTVKPLKSIKCQHKYLQFMPCCVWGFCWLLRLRRRRGVSCWAAAAAGCFLGRRSGVQAHYKRIVIVGHNAIDAREYRINELIVSLLEGVVGHFNDIILQIP